ncbi:MAG TPA: RagB/SusD family nutrient uptake outer membrane protein [Bacteroidales bacterium]|nr:RagB/SusD family nutrient uptake outer membrane protein [Bacteroidales bacterium]
MRNILKISAALLVMLVAGCTKDYLNPVPQTSLSDLSVFQNKARIVAQVNGMYAAVKNGQYLGGRYQVIADVRSDNFIPISSNAVTLYDSWGHKEGNSSDEVKNTWGAIYAAVNVINCFMDGLKSNWDGGTLNGIITQDEYNQYMSEGLALRAMCYFDLIRLYAKPYIKDNGDNPGVPLRVQAEKSSAGNDLAPSKVSEIYTQILADLNAAEPLAVKDYVDPTLNTTRVQVNTIVALKVRVLLTKGDWAGVVTESNKLISSATAPFKTPSGVVDNELNSSFTDIFVSNTSQESIFSMPNTPINNGGGQTAITWYFSKDSGESFYLVDSLGAVIAGTTVNSVYSLMDPTDVRRSSMASRTVAGSTKPAFFLTKYTHYTTLQDWCPVLRYAEVLLSRAEALAHTTTWPSAEAIALLNAVRTRSFTTGAYAAGDFADATAFEAACLKERDFEFLGEGMRSFDLMRLGMDIPAKMGMVMGSVNPLPSTSTSYYFPIPSTETAVNTLAGK